MQKVGYGLFCFIFLNLVVMPIQSLGKTSTNSLQKELAHLEALSGGRLGLAAIDTGNNQRIQYRAQEFFPMGCTSKVMGVAAVLKKSMYDSQLLQEKIYYTQNDLTNWTPITGQHLNEGMTIEALCAAAISYSDNTAMNLLTKKLGGLSKLNAFARSIQDKDFKLDHGWPEEALSSPQSRKDETTPAAMEASLYRLIFGDALGKTEKNLLATWLKQNTTGNTRIRAGVPKGWIVGDKTGSGFHYGTTNDIAVIWPPNCSPLIITIFYSSNNKEAAKREDLLAAATREIIAGFAQKNPCIQKALFR